MEEEKYLWCAPDRESQMVELRSEAPEGMGFGGRRERRELSSCRRDSFRYQRNAHDCARMSGPEWAKRVVPQE